MSRNSLNQECGPREPANSNMASELNQHSHQSQNGGSRSTSAVLSETEVQRLTGDCCDGHPRCRRRDSDTDSIMSTSVNDTTLTAETITKILIVPTGLKVVALVSMITAIVLIVASGILLYKSNQTLVAWLKAAPTTLILLSQVNKLFGGTSSVVQEVESQEKYLRLLIICSATLITAGLIQLACNIWFFFRMNSACVSRCLTKTDEFCCGY